MSDEILTDVVEEPEVTLEPTEVEEPEVIEEPELETEEPEAEPEKNDQIPLAKYMAEKKKRQEIEAKLQEKMDQETNNQKRLQMFQKYKGMGYPDDVAWQHATDQVEQEHQNRLIQTQYEQKLFDIELDLLSKSNQFYADANQFRDEILTVIRKTQLPIQQAYMVVRGEARTQEVAVQKEQQAKAKAKPRTVPSASAQPIKSRYNLDEADRKALEGLKKMDPGGGWTVEKYSKLMKE